MFILPTCLSFLVELIRHLLLIVSIDGNILIHIWICTVCVVLMFCVYNINSVLRAHFLVIKDCWANSSVVQRIKFDKFWLLCSADPTHVIGLYPDLLPSDYRKQLHYPNPLPTLSGAELEKAHLALIDYLTQVCMMSVMALCQTPLYKGFQL